MKKSRFALLSLALAFGLSNGIFVSCSGTSEATDKQDPLAAQEPSRLEDGKAQEASYPRESNDRETYDRETYDRETGSAVVQGDGAKTGQNPEPAPDPQDELIRQKTQLLIQETLKKANRAADLKLWEDVIKACTDVRRLDNNNEQAVALLRRANAAIGDRTESLGEYSRRHDWEMEIEKQRDLERAMGFKRDGKFASEQKEYDKAIQAYEQSLLTLKYSPWFRPGSETERELKALLAQAVADKKAYQKHLESIEADEARKTILSQERQADIRRQARVQSLFEQANLAFQSKFYGRSVELLDEAINLDPLNEEAKALHELAMRAVHDQRMDRIQLEWNHQWARTFQQMETADVMQTDTIKWNIKHWRDDVINRKPLEFSHGKGRGEDDSANIAVLKVLEETKVDHDFAETSIEEWVDFYKSATNLTFLISGKVAELDEEETTLTGFNIGRKSIRAALGTIAEITPLRWRIKNGVVWIQTKDESSGDLIPHIYDVREIVNPLSNYPGRDIQQRIGDGDDGGGDEEEPTPIVVDIGKLQELIKANIDPDSWERDGVDIMEAGGSSLIVTQTAEVQAKVGSLLHDLRKASGVHVDIQARFLTVEDNFLEEIGVDFRGLGDQSSSGIPGKGLGGREGFAFNDYGQNPDDSNIGRDFTPGIFYDDGGDGDFLARTENIFDRSLGGDRINNAGGLSLQWTFLDDTQVETVLRAVSKQERALQLSAPRILVHNTARANLMVTNQFSYIRDFNVEIAQAAAVADPVVDIIRDGVILDVRPVVSADRRFILMELRPTLAKLKLPIPTFTTTLGVGQQVSIQLPELLLNKVRTTVTLPDGGTLLLGGMKASEKQFLESGIPFLKDLPLLSFLFSKKGTSKSHLKTLILMQARVVIPQETEPVPYESR